MLSIKPSKPAASLKPQYLEDIPNETLISLQPVFDLPSHFYFFLSFHFLCHIFTSVKKSLLSLKPTMAPLADITPQVIEYLVKKGYNRTEQMLRQESSHLDKEGKPIHDRVEDLGTMKYTKAYRLLSNWVDQNLDIYKVSSSKHQPVCARADSQ